MECKKKIYFIFLAGMDFVGCAGGGLVVVAGVGCRFCFCFFCPVCGGIDFVRAAIFFFWLRLGIIKVEEL